MIKLIVLLAILFFALLFGHTLLDQEGMVIIALPGTVIELTIISAVMVVFFSLIIFWLLTWAFKRIFALLTGSRNWLGTFSKRKRNKAFYSGLQAYLIGDFKTAATQIEKSFGGDFSGTNYILAADIDARVNQGKNVAGLMTHAQVDAGDTSGAVLKQAQLALLDNQPQRSLDLLTQLSEKEQKHPVAVQLRLQSLAKLNRWTDVKDWISEHRKVIADDYLTWAQRATHGEFAEIASKHGANALKEKWQNLSRSARKDVANQICYVQLLLEQGLSSDAETILVDAASTQEHDAYWGLFKQLDHASPARAIKFVEQKIKQQPSRAILYSVLAHLAFNSKDYSLAQRAINKAVDLERKPQDLLLLAAILEQQQYYQQANQLYKSLM
jgi:HemY protein